MDAPKVGSFRYNFAEKSKERILSQKLLSTAEWDFGGEDRDGDPWYKRLVDWVEKFRIGVKDIAIKAWDFGRGDPRKAVFSAKMGLALVIISLSIFFKEPSKDLSRYSVWAILTVVVIFEFSIGRRSIAELVLF